MVMDTGFFYLFIGMVVIIPILSGFLKRSDSVLILVQ